MLELSSLAVIGWGNQQNKQHFKCKNCGILFTHNKSQTIQNRFVWFKKWVLDIHTRLYKETAVYQEIPCKEHFIIF